MNAKRSTFLITVLAFGMAFLYVPMVLAVEALFSASDVPLG